MRTKRGRPPDHRVRARRGGPGLAVHDQQLVTGLDPGAVVGDPGGAAADGHDPAAIRAYWDELEAADPDPRLNRAIGDNYPPGSLFKVIVAAAALRRGWWPRLPFSTR